jgi:hypothetical protein
MAYRLHALYGALEHRAVARREVCGSLVLLKNLSGVLPAYSDDSVSAPEVMTAEGLARLVQDNCSSLIRCNVHRTRATTVDQRGIALLESAICDK